MHDLGRVEYVSASDDEALEAFKTLSQTEGIIPAIESAHAFAVLDEIKLMPEIKHIQSFASKTGIIKTKSENEGVLLKGVRKDYDASFLGKNMKAGKMLNIEDSIISNDVVISQSLANRLELTVGGKMMVYFVTEKKQTDSTNYTSF